MKALVYRTSDWDINNIVMEFDTINDLLNLAREENELLIIDVFNNLWDNKLGPAPDFSVEIYDNYRE